MATAGAKDAPAYAVVQVTERCNYDCVHCYQSHEKLDELTLDEIRRVLDELAHLGVLFLTLMGGEFFTRRDADDILRAARERGFAVKLLTTGHYINDRRADLIRDLGAIGVDLSVYSANHKVHDRVTTVPGSWQRTVAAAKRLLARNVLVVLKSPVMEDNVAGLAELAQLARSIGAGYQFDPKVAGRSDGTQEPTTLRASREALREFYTDATIGAWEAWAGVEETGVEQIPLNYTPCRAGQRVLSIGPVGQVWPCNVLPISCGNVREQSIGEIWATSPQMAHVRTLSWAKIDECNQCELRSYCSRCHAMAMLETGKLEGPSLESCRHAVITRDLLRERGLISQSETMLPPTWPRVLAMERELIGERAVRPSGLRVLP